MSQELHREILRWCAGIAFFGLALYCAKTGYVEERYSLMVAGAPLFAIGLLIVWRPLFAIATRPLFLLIESIVFPGEKLSKPVLNLKLPAYYLEQERYTEARNEYWKIVRHHPDEVEAYEKLIWLALEVFDDRPEAERLLRKARRRHLVLEPGIDRRVRMASPDRSDPGEND